jgi:hypothetical protein
MDLRQSAALLYAQFRTLRPEHRAGKITGGSAAEYTACVRVRIRQFAACQFSAKHHAPLMMAVARVTHTNDCSSRPHDTPSYLMAEASTRPPHRAKPRALHTICPCVRPMALTTTRWRSTVAY